MRRPSREFVMAAAWSGVACAALAGCLQRRLYITSEPPGAIVRLNDLDVGRTPVEVDFEWYGAYDVRLDLEGYEPLVTSAKADAPVHEWPGIDFVTMALPIQFKDEVRWHFELTPAASDPQAAITRGREVRAMLPVRTSLPPGDAQRPTLPHEPAPALEPATEPIEAAPPADD